MHKIASRNNGSTTRKDWLTWLAISWILLFTGAAMVAQVLESTGSQLLAYPEQAFLPPFKNAEHLLGTDQLGRDVWTYLFYSCRTAWLLVFPPLFLASLFGVFIGTTTALIGNKGIKISLLKLSALLFVTCVGCYFWSAVKWNLASYLPNFLQPTIPLLVGYLFLLAGLYWVLLRVCNGLATKSKHLTLDIDGILQRVINIWSTFPKLLLLLLVTTFTPFSILILIGWISATYWVLPARVANATVKQIKQESFFEASTTLGLPFQRILLFYVWPVMKGPIITNFCFSASGLLAIGSTLAYLGIGLPADVPSWGKMLALSRYSIEAWWLLVFPSLILLVSIFSLQRIGHVFAKASS